MLLTPQPENVCLIKWLKAQLEKSYDTAASMIGLRSNNGRILFSTTKRNTIIEDIIKRSKNMPGPSDYENRQYKRIKGSWK